tara:strand:- start:5476 stop:5637 length:162 start_codon:yes stop_codon:yes gene_type:complete
MGANLIPPAEIASVDDGSERHLPLGLRFGLSRVPMADRGKVGRLVSALSPAMQ